LILGFLFISEKNAVASCRANSKTFVEKLKEQGVFKFADF